MPRGQLEGTDTLLPAPLTAGGRTRDTARQRPPWGLSSCVDPTAQLSIEALWRAGEMEGGEAQRERELSVCTAERPNHSKWRVSVVQTTPEKLDKLSRKE